jgi:hypothetical protein
MAFSSLKPSRFGLLNSLGAMTPWKFLLIVWHRPKNGMTWSKSSHPDYAGQPVEVKADATLKSPLEEDMGLVLRDGAKKYGVGTAFSKPLSLGEGGLKNLVLQYEVIAVNKLSLNYLHSLMHFGTQVKLTQGLTCGGAYLKMLRSEDTEGNAVDMSAFHGGSPYTIMFGPDSCGDTVS